MAVSRDPNDLHPDLKRAWEYLRDRFVALYPDAPEPRLSCTYRGKEEQEAAFKAGKSMVRFGESLHNYLPAYAFDVYFNDDRGTPVDKSDDRADWDFVNFQRFGALAKEIGLLWGGDWPGLVDGPHIQFNMTFMDARAGLVPAKALAKLPYAPALDSSYTPAADSGYTPQEAQGTHGQALGSSWRIVNMMDRQVQEVFEISQRDTVIRISPAKRAIYVDARDGE